MFPIIILLTATFVSGSDEESGPETILSATDALDGILAATPDDLTEAVADVVDAAAQVAATATGTSIEDEVPITLLQPTSLTTELKFRVAAGRVLKMNRHVAQAL